MSMMKTLKGSNLNEWTSSLLMGFGCMFMFTGFDTHSFIIEYILHSVNDRDPTRIDRYAGYYGQSVDYIVFTIANLFAPLLIRYANPKWSIFIGSIAFTLYQAGFLYLNSYYFYISSAVMGAGFAMFYAGQGRYLTEHSTEKNIARNFSVFWAVGCMSMALGGLILLVINETSAGGPNRTRDFSDRKIRLIFGAFSLLSFLSNVIFLLLPKRKPENALEDNSDLERGFWDTLSFTFKAFASPKLWLLSFSWMYLGLSTAFYLGPYPTALIFTESLTDHTTLIPFYACSIGFGEIVCGLIISYGSNKVRNFARLPTVIIAVVTHLITFLIILLSTPRESSLRPTKQPTLLIEPNIYLPFLCGFLIGVSDGCWNTLRNCIVATLMPRKRAQGFSLSKFFQSLASFALFLLSPMLDIYAHITILFVSMLIASTTFILVVIRANQKERKIESMVVVLNTRHCSWSMDFTPNQTVSEAQFPEGRESLSTQI